MWFDFLLDWNETAVNSIMHIIALIFFLFGILTLSLWLIIIAVVLVALGHIIQAIIMEKPVPKGETKTSTRP